MQSKLVITAAVTLALYCVCTSCAVLESVMDTTMSVFDSDGEETEVAIGDVVADAVTSDEASGIIGTLLGAHPGLAAGAGAAAAMLAGAARRKKKLKAEAEKRREGVSARGVVFGGLLLCGWPPRCFPS